MKKILISLLMLSAINAFALDAEIVSDLPAQMRETQAKIDLTSQLQSVMDGLSKAQTTQQQIQSLTQLRNLQNDPASSVIQVNSAVKGLLNNFNQLNNSGFSNLSQLINSLASSSSSVGMGLKLAQASNMQLAGIQQTLNALQAQNQAYLAYKQAEINDAQKAKQAMQSNNQATASRMMQY